MALDFNWFAQYNKLYAALLGTIVSAVLAALAGDQTIDPSEWVNIAIAAVGVFTVWYYKNDHAQPATKAGLAGVAAALVALNSVITDGGVSFTEWIQIAIAGLTAAGVYRVPNKGVASVVP